jgi:hypothetical protein
VEFPFGDHAHELLAVFYAGYHRRPILNGYSGYFPASYSRRVPVLQDPIARPEEAAEVLQVSGATHALVHEGAFTDQKGRDISAWLVAVGARPVTTASDDKLFALR